MLVIVRISILAGTFLDRFVYTLVLILHGKKSL
jgi:hypothetical protein